MKKQTNKLKHGYVKILIDDQQLVLLLLHTWMGSKYLLI
jgi:hypothetical protein